MRTIVIDIETLPNVDVETYADLVEITAPANYKDADKISAYIAEKRLSAVADISKEAALSPLYGRVLCVGYDIIGGDKEALIHTDEKKVLESLKSELESDKFRLITFNGRDFDIRYLDMRFRLNGIESPFREQHLKAFDDAFHTDLYMKLTSNGKVKGSYLRNDLKTVSNFLGYRSDTGDLDGSCVLPMFLDGKFDEIASYCLDDVARTRFIAERLGYVR